MRSAFIALAGGLALASAAAGQGVMYFQWIGTDTGNGDGDLDPGEGAILTLWATMDPRAVGFAGSIYDVIGVSNWERGIITSYDNFLNDFTDDGTLHGNNDITGIEAFQLPPLFNPDFDASNPVALYEIVWEPQDYSGYFVEARTFHLTSDVYIDEFGTSVPYDAVVEGFRFFVGVPGPATVGVLGMAGLWGRRRRY